MAPPVLVPAALLVLCLHVFSAQAGTVHDPRGTLGTGWHRYPIAGKGAPVALQGVYAGSSGFLAVSDDGSWVSSDGKTWKAAPSDLLRYAENQHIPDLNLVRVGLDGAVLGNTYSTKGEGPNGGYIGVGSYWPPGQTTAKIRAEVALSADGRSWHIVTGKGKTFLGATMKDVARGGPGWVAAGFDWGPLDEPVIWTSTDATHWQRIAQQPAGYGQIDWLIHGPGGLLAVSSGYDGPAQTWLSGDGLRWQPASGNPFRGALLGQVTGTGTGYLAAGVQDDEPALWTSSDGLHWQRVAGAASFTGDLTALQGIAQRGQTVVAVGRYATVAIGQYGPRASPFLASSWVWTPAGSALQPTPVPRTGTVSPKVFRLRLSDLLDPYFPASGMGGFADLCDDGNTLCNYVSAAVGPYLAYQVSFGRGAPITQIDSMTIEGSRSNTHALATLATHLVKWWNRSGKFKRVTAPTQIGQETRVYRGSTPATSIPPGGTFVVFAVEWRDGKSIGQVYVAQQPQGKATAVETLALDLAHTQWQHLRDAGR